MPHCWGSGEFSIMDYNDGNDDDNDDDGDDDDNAGDDDD